MTDPRAYEPFPPETIGHAGREMILGKHSGRASVLHAMQAEGVSVDKEEAANLLAQIRKQSQRSKSLISSPRLLEIFAERAAAESTPR